jgi:hypothetical protein
MSHVVMRRLVLNYSNLIVKRNINIITKRNINTNNINTNNIKKILDKSITIVKPDSKLASEFILDKNRQTVNQEKIGFFKKMKLIGKQYGVVFFVTYWTLWGGVLGGTYLLVRNGIITDKTIFLPQILSFINNRIDNVGTYSGKDLTPYHVKLEGTSRDFMTALLFAKVTKIIQLPIAAYITPMIARRIGYVVKQKL